MGRPIIVVFQLPTRTEGDLAKQSQYHLFERSKERDSGSARGAEGALDRERLASPSSTRTAAALVSAWVRQAKLARSSRYRAGTADPVLAANMR
jgi:hypothetical protein